MGTTSAGVVYWNSTQAASVAAGTAALANSINTKVVGHYSSATARDIAYTGLSSAAKGGVLCWVDDRAGWSFWNTNTAAWQWLTLANVLYTATNPPGADATPGTAGSVLLATPTTALPPGNRLVKVECRGVAQTLGSGANRALGFIAGGLVPVGQQGNNEMWVDLPAGVNNPYSTYQGAWTVKASGNFNCVLYGKAGVMNTRFLDANLTVTDLGPTDL